MRVLMRSLRCRESLILELLKDARNNLALVFKSLRVAQVQTELRYCDVTAFHPPTNHAT